MLISSHRSQAQALLRNPSWSTCQVWLTKTLTYEVQSTLTCCSVEHCRNTCSVASHSRYILSSSIELYEVVTVDYVTYHRAITVRCEPVWVDSPLRDIQALQSVSLALLQSNSCNILRVRAITKTKLRACKHQLEEWSSLE